MTDAYDYGSIFFYASNPKFTEASRKRKCVKNDCKIEICDLRFFELFLLWITVSDKVAPLMGHI